MKRRLRISFTADADCQQCNGTGIRYTNVDTGPFVIGGKRRTSGFGIKGLCVCVASEPYEVRNE